MAFQFLPFLAFAVAASVTPGPNNVMVAAAAANFGIRAAVPMMLGIALGFCPMVLVMGLGLAAPLAYYPHVHRVLRWVGIVWMLYLAWKIAHSGAPRIGGAKAPLGIVGASLFQWVNPKAWLLALAVATTWTSVAEPVAPQVAQMALIFFFVSHAIQYGMGLDRRQRGATAAQCCPATLVQYRHGTAADAFGAALGTRGLRASTANHRGL